MALRTEEQPSPGAYSRRWSVSALFNASATFLFTGGSTGCGGELRREDGDAPEGGPDKDISPGVTKGAGLCAAGAAGGGGGNGGGACCCGAGGGTEAVGGGDGGGGGAAQEASARAARAGSRKPTRRIGRSREGTAFIGAILYAIPAPPLAGSAERGGCPPSPVLPAVTASRAWRQR